MAEILHTGERLRLRKATLADLDFIIQTEYDPENVQFIVPFDRDFHTKVLNGMDNTIDGIVEEIETGERVGYVLINGLKSDANEMEWTHIIVTKKGRGYGHETMKLLKAFAFEDKKFHRVWLDCKDYNARALHLYESEGLLREGLFRDTLLTNGKYENLVVLAMLEDEYKQRKAQGLELTK